VVRVDVAVDRLHHVDQHRNRRWVMVHERVHSGALKLGREVPALAAQVEDLVVPRMEAARRWQADTTVSGGAGKEREGEEMNCEIVGTPLKCCAKNKQTHMS
jgi:hypothetical protein